MNHIIVTTPKSEMVNAAKEAAFAKKDKNPNCARYFRRFPLGKAPKIEHGSYVFYVEDGYVRGFCMVSGLKDIKHDITCRATEKRYKPGTYVMMLAATWYWIKPIPMKGFKGYRYAAPDFKYEIVGDWKDPRPEVS